MQPRARIAITVIAVLAVIALLVPLAVGAYRNATRPPVIITMPPGMNAPAPLPQASNAASSIDAATGPSSNSGTIYVHVAGAVKSPDVYKMANGQRVFEAIKAAGGALKTADIDAINLAEPVHDGEKVYIPTKAEVASQSSALPDSGNSVGETSDNGRPELSASGKAASASSGAITKLKAPGAEKIDINTASESELEELPGVGPAMAGRILTVRQQIHRFRTPQDLLMVRGLGVKKYDRLLPFIKT